MAVAASSVRRISAGCGRLAQRPTATTFTKTILPAASAATAPSRAYLVQRRLSAPPLNQYEGSIHRRSLFNFAAAALGQTSQGSEHTLATVRTMPYAAPDLFAIIANVEAYSEFLPHCSVSRVTHWRTVASAQWPARADLSVGFGPLSQTYSSRVYCVPRHGVVEAVSGRLGKPTLTPEERAEIGLDQEENRPEASMQQKRNPKTEDDTFESLVTRWTVVPQKNSSPSSPQTRVELRIRFQFRNPLYQMAAAQVGNEMATKMIEAFTKRTETLLGSQTRGRL